MDFHLPSLFENELYIRVSTVNEALAMVFVSHKPMASIPETIIHTLAQACSE